jgi:hypothetical protein
LEKVEQNPLLEKVEQKAKRLEAKRLKAKRLKAKRLEAKRLEAKRLEAKRLKASSFWNHMIMRQHHNQSQIQVARVAKTINSQTITNWSPDPAGGSSCCRADSDHKFVKFVTAYDVVVASRQNTPASRRPIWSPNGIIVLRYAVT